MQLNFHLVPRTVAALAFLIVAAFAGNYFHLHLFIGACFLFGSIATLLVLRLFGLGWGVAAGVAGAAFVLFETSNYAAAATLLVLEPLIVGLALRYGRCRNIALVDGAYWLLLGMPLMLGMELWLLHGDLSSAWYFAMILGFNGIFNALVAGLLLDYLPLRRWVGAVEAQQRVALRHLVFNLLAAFLVFSAFLVIVLNGEDEVQRMESHIQGQLHDYALEIQLQLASGSDRRQQLMGLPEVKKLLEMHARENGIKITLLDRQLRVIASTRGDLAELERMPQPGKTSAPVWDASAGMVTSGLSLQRIYAARYVSETRVGPDNTWTLYLEIPARPYFLALQQRLANNLILVWAGIIAAFLVASLVSRRLVEPLERLVEATTHIKARLLGNEDVRLDHSPVREIDALVENFGEMAQELNRSYSELGSSNETLEQVVAARTKELTHVNQQLKQHLAEREQFEVALARHAQELERTSAELMSQKFALDQHSIVAIADPQGNITYANDKFCEISEYSREELLGQNHCILNSGVHERQFFKDMWTTMVSGKVWQGEVCNRKKGGDLYWVETTIVPFMDAGGSPYQYVAIRSDITERKQAERELLRAKEAAETANRAKSEFLSRMSHELRTPLNAILGFGQLLESDTQEPLTISQLENVEQITKAGWHLLELVNEVLDLARIEAGKMQVQMTDLLLADVVGECIGLIAPLAAERRIQVSDEISPCMTHHVRANHTRLKQVLLNYLSNAVKYNRQGGEIVLKCAQLPGGLLRVSVSDTGPGIPDSKLDELFLPFNRLDADDTDVQGAGVGLAVVKRLVELMDGSVGVSSAVGRGSTFWVDMHEVFPGAEEATPKRVRLEAI